jgi:signal transduction histidine kinase/putative methionine-R-sulfoxide reductase with GAF domain
MRDQHLTGEPRSDEQELLAKGKSRPRDSARSGQRQGRRARPSANGRVPGGKDDAGTAARHPRAATRASSADGPPDLMASARNADRLEALRRTALLDTPAEVSYDRLTQLGCKFLATPAALVTLVDADRLFLKSACGLEESLRGGRELPLRRSFCAHTVALGEPLVVADAREHPWFRGDETVHTSPFVAYLGVPLILANGHAIGCFGALDVQPRQWTDDEVHLARDLAATTVALIELRLAAEEARLHTEEAEQERARLLQYEHDARALAEAATSRFDALQAVSDTALSHLALDELLRELVARVRSILSVDNVAILLLDAEGRELRVRTALGLEEEVAAGVRIPFGKGVAGHIAASRQPVIIDDLSQVEVYNPFLKEKLVSLLGVPLVVEDRVIGVIHVSTAAPRHFTQQEQELLQLVADRAAIAIDHSTLYEAERVARQRLAFLAEAGMTLVSSLDYDAILDHLARLTVPGLGDWCAIDVVQDAGNVERLAVAHVDPVKVEQVMELSRRHPVDPQSQHPLAGVLRSRRPLLVSEITQGDLATTTLSEEELDAVQVLGLRSFMIVPLVTRDRVLGAITLATTSESDRRYRDEDVALVEELARRAALAVENAQLYHGTQAALRSVEEIAERLAQQAAQLDTIIEAIPDGVYVCDAEGMRSRVNAPGAALLGLTMEQALQPIAAYWDLIRPRYLDGTPIPVEDFPLSQALRGIIRTDIRFIVCHHISGDDVHLLASCAPIRNAAGVITGAVAVCSDISELQRLERQKDEFLSVASHELKTPLTSLKILTQLAHRQLQRTGIGGLEHMDRMEHSIIRMERLVNDLLDVSRIESGRLALRLEPLDLVSLCRHVAAEQMAASEREIALELPREPTIVRADADRIDQVLANLLSNALKYSPQERPVTLTVRIEAAHVVVAIRDEGSGIPQEALPHLFERFYRVPGVQVQSGSGVGLGLGLYITRELVERHGGQIRAESTPGFGTTLSVMLPLADAQPSPLA